MSRTYRTALVTYTSKRSDNQYTIHNPLLGRGFILFLFYFGNTNKIKLSVKSFEASNNIL